MALSYTTITGTFKDGSGAAEQGSGFAQPSADIYNSSGSLVIAATQIQVAVVAGNLQLASNGAPVSLLATDNAGLSPAGKTAFWYWTISLTLGNELAVPWSFFLPSSPSTVDISKLTAAGVTYPYVPLAGGTMTGELAVPDLAVAGLTGATQASRWVGATASGAPVSGTFRTLDWVTDATGKVWICTAGGTPGTWTAAGPTIPVTIAQGGSGQTTQQAAIDALTGAQSAGKVLHSDGTHATLQALAAADLAAVANQQGYTELTLAPDGSLRWGKPWQFHVGAYGAKGDGKVVTDGVMTSGSAALACATSTPFTSTAVDAGKSILVSTAKGSYAHLAGTISTVTDPGHATLSASATASTGAPGAITYFGTDDTAAIKAALAAAVAYAQANRGYAEVVFDPLTYIIAGAATIGGTTLGNAQIPLPVIAGTAPKVTIGLRGAMDSTALNHWLQNSPVASGTVLACARTDGTNDGTNGPASVIGGPFNGYGGALGLFTNLLVVVDGIEILVPYNSTFGGFDFFGVAAADIRNAACMAAAVVPSGGAAPVPNMTNPNNISNQYTAGLKMPCSGNNAIANVGWFSCEGLCYGFMPSEHTDAQSVRAIYCIIGIEGYSGNGVTMPHAGRIHYACSEANAQGLGFFDGTVRLDIDTLDVESVANYVYDPSNRGQGTIQFRGDIGSGYSSGGVVNGGAGVRIINLNQPSGPVASPQAPPANNAAWLNGYYRDAWITQAATTLTALKIDATAQNGLAGSPAAYAFLLPAGHSYTPTFTGALSHTVTLV